MASTTPLLTVEDVASILKVRESFVRSEIASGAMPHTRLGSRKYLRVSDEQLQAYIASKQTKEDVDV